MAEAASVLFVNGEPISVQRSDVDHNAFHRHNFLEIAYIAKGTAIHDFNHTTVTVHEGDYFAIDYNEAHRFQHDSAYSGKFEVKCRQHRRTGPDTEPPVGICAAEFCAEHPPQGHQRPHVVYPILSLGDVYADDGHSVQQIPAKHPAGTCLRPACKHSEEY